MFNIKLEIVILWLLILCVLLYILGNSKIFWEWLLVNYNYGYMIGWIFKLMNGVFCIRLSEKGGCIFCRCWCGKGVWVVISWG